MEHESAGEGEERFITVFMAPKPKEDAQPPVEAAEASPEEKVAEDPPHDEWWRLKVFYDRYRPDFALVRGLDYIPVSSETRLDKVPPRTQA